MADVFEDHPTIDQERAKLWELIKQTPYLDWQILTKRADRIKKNLPEDWDNGYPNVWLGVSVEHDEYAWRFNDHLLHIPASVRFVSYEPALGPLTRLWVQHVDWLIYGGESGPGYRADDRDWARDIRDQCRKVGTAFFHKQSSGPDPGMGVELDGEIIQEFPRPRIATGSGEP
jgi:protein gp37